MSPKTSKGWTCYSAPFIYKANTGFNFYWNKGTFTRVLRKFREEKPILKLSSSYGKKIRVLQKIQNTLVVFDSLG